MAGIAGAPEPKPSQVNQPVPGASALDAFMSSQGAEAKAAGSAMGNANPPAPAAAPTAPQGGGSALDQFMSTQGQPAQAAQGPGYKGPGAGLLQGVADAAPFAGGLLGGAASMPDGFLTAGITAALGASAGQSVKRLIETQILGKPAKGYEQELVDNTKEAVTTGIAQVLGMGAEKQAVQAGKAIKGAIDASPLAQSALKAVGDKSAAMVESLSNIATPALTYIKGAIGDAKAKLTQPVNDILAKFALPLAEDGTPQTTEQVGNNVKKLFGEDIRARFGTFVDSYKTLDDTAKVLPLGSDETRLKFTKGLEEWSLTNGWGKRSENYSMVKKFTDKFNAAENGAEFNNITKELTDKMKQAYGDNLKSAGDAYRALRDKSEDFMENQTLNLAKRIQAGTASEADKAFITQAAQSQGIQEADPMKYAKSIAKDFLDNRDTVKNSYAKFRSFLEDVGEQAKVNPEGRGPLQFLKDVQDVPSEKLMANMFQDKNAAALRAMQKETPQVFDQVVKSKMNGIIRAASASGEPDLKMIQATLNKMEPGARRFLVSDAELATINKTMQHPNLVELKNVENDATSSIINHVVKIGKLANFNTKAVAGKVIDDAPGFVARTAQRPIPQAARQQAIGKALEPNALVNAFTPAQGPQQ